MDREVIEAKLESLRRCLQRMRDKLPTDAAALARDLDCQDIVALNLVRAVQVSADISAHIVAERGWPIPATMGESFQLLAEHGLLSTDTALRMRAAVGFRNIAVHNYQRIDWDIVHAIVQRHLADFDAFASAVVAAIEVSGSPIPPTTA
jgi:uncharacterized protein YutE (UPF0331/DUF86 family)